MKSYAPREMLPDVPFLIGRRCYLGAKPRLFVAILGKVFWL